MEDTKVDGGTSTHVSTIENTSILSKDATSVVAERGHAVIDM